MRVQTRARLKNVLPIFGDNWNRLGVQLSSATCQAWSQWTPIPHQLTERLGCSSQERKRTSGNTKRAQFGSNGPGVLQSPVPI